MKISEGLFSRESVLILFSVVLISFLTVSAQEANADIIFNDPFDVDPAANGWTEKIVQVPVGSLPVTATGDISPNGEGHVVLEKTGEAGALELSITRTIDTTDFENIKLGLTAKQSPVNYESEDFIRIEYNSGSGFVTLLEDHEVWMGEGKPTADGNTVFTSTGDLSLPADASNIASLMLRITVFIDAVNEDTFFDDFVVKGESATTSTPQEAADDLTDDIQDLIDEETLNGGQGNSLISKLQNIIEKLNNDQTNAACNQLGAFINQVTAFINGGTLTSAEGQALIDAAQDIKDAAGDGVCNTLNRPFGIATDSSGNVFVTGSLSDNAFKIELQPLSDHYLGYEAKTTKKTPKFSKETVTLDDQFEQGTYKVEKTVRLYNPVDKNNEGITDEITHLKGYKIKPFKDSVTVIQSSDSGIEVSNQFGTLVVGTIKSELLLVPAAKDPDNPVDKLTSTSVDHYKCYKIKVIADSQSRDQVSLEDQFVNKEFNVGKPTMLCNPVDKNDEGIINSDNHLMCYEIKDKFKKTGIHTHDQFGAEQLDTKKIKELCVPSEKNILP